MKEQLFNPQVIIPAFDQFLGHKGLNFTAIAIGGAALSVLGIVSRHTRDLDVLAPAIPEGVQNAAVEFAHRHALSEDWLNTGPSSLTRDLPAGWQERTQPLYAGKHLELSTLSRLDLIRAKLWAMCDRMRDLEDLVALAPSDQEINLAAAWVIPLDGNPNWPDHVQVNVALLHERLRRG